MRSTLLAFAVLLSSGCVVIDAADTDIERINQTAPLAPGGTLKLKNFSGQVTITGTDRQDASIDAVRRGSRERLDHIKMDIHQEGSTLVVNANRRDGSSWSRHRNNVVETDFTIQVPRRTSLDAELFSSPLSVEGLEGSHKVHGFSSRVRFENVTGPVRVHTFSGHVDIRTRAWSPDQSVDIDTFSGGVDLHVPDSAAGTISFHSFSGHLNSDIPLTLRSGNRRSLRADLGTGSGSTLRFKTFSGSVRINR
jgi:DUF4097 and DUF4098 domain-containing protein YvlB